MCHLRCLTVFPKTRRFRRLRRPGSSRHRASPWAAPVPPTERAGSKGSVLCCLSAASPLWWLAPPPSPPLRGGTMDVGQWRPFEFMAAAERKPYNRASPGKTSKPGCARGNAPLLPTAPPPEGEVLAPLYLEMLMSSEAERRAKFPLRGKGGALAPKGVHFQRAQPGCKGFPAAVRRHTKLIAVRRYHPL
jgi:hypothetical protein